MEKIDELSLIEIDSILQEELTPNLLISLFSKIKVVIDSGRFQSSVYSNKSLLRALRFFLCDKDREVRVVALRAVRYLLVAEPALVEIKHAKLLHFIVRGFETDGKNNERIEACKIIKNWLEMSPATFPQPFMTALVSLAETETEDELKDFAVEAIRILSVSNTALVAWSGGFRILITWILNPKVEETIVKSTVLTLLYLLNSKETRQYLKKEKELSRIFSIFTDIEPDLRDSELDAMILLAKKVLIMMSRSWVGLIFLASGGLKQIIDNLCLPIRPKLKEAILEVIEEMINIRVDSSQKSRGLLKNYLAMLLKALIHCNLYTALTTLSIDKSDAKAQRARKLLKQVITTASDLLPDAPQFSLMLDSQKSVITAELVAEIDSSTRLKGSSGQLGLLYKSCELLSKEPNSHIESQNTVTIGIYKSYGINNVDDSIFNNLMKESKVLKDANTWDWDIIYQLMAGPISTPQRFMQAHRQRFLRCLLTYFVPSRGLFSTLRWHPNDFLKAQVGMLLIGLLMSQTEGIQLLTTTIHEGFFVMRKSFMGEIVDAIGDEISVIEGGRTSSSRLFNPERMKISMVREYIKWIGMMTYYKSGLTLLNNTNLDNKLMKLSKVEHLSTVIIPYLNYQETFSKDYLSFALQSEDFLVRKNAMEHVRLVFRAGIYELNWAVREIVNQLYSTDSTTVKCALSVIEELCTNNQNLKAFIETGPQTLTGLGEEGAKCLISFLSSSTGISYLSQLDFISKELQKWKATGNLDYVMKVEQQSEIALTSQKQVYALDVHTPFGNSYSDRVEPMWLRKLPFTIVVYVSGHKKTLSLNTWIEIKDEVSIMSRVPELEIYENDTISICLQLGISNIDSKGQETLDSNWVKCLPQDRESCSGDSLEKFGVIFKFASKSNHLYLAEVSYRVQILPKATPSIKFPKHLYGELVQTKSGLKKLQESKHVEELAEILKAEASIVQKRVALWALGHVGTSERGIAYLQKLNVVSHIVEASEKSPVLSLRGTAFQSLCLLASTNEGRKELLKYGWICSQANIAMPSHSEAIFWLDNENSFVNFSIQCSTAEEVIENIPLTIDEQEVLYNIVGLGNVVRRSEAEVYLKAKRASSPASFVGINLFHAVMSYLSMFTFKFGTRKIIHKLMEKIYTLQRSVHELDNFAHIT